MVEFIDEAILFVKDVFRGLKEPESILLIFFISLIVAIGTLFYSFVEGWRMLDSLYFTIMTITTVGYGDFVPKTDLGKIFTIVYVFIGLGLLLAFINVIIKKAIELHHFKKFGSTTAFIKELAKYKQKK